MCIRDSSYTVRDKETDVELDIDNEYIMSPKDLKTIHFMNKMLDADVYKRQPLMIPIILPLPP